MLNYTSLLEINDTVTVIRITIPKLDCSVILKRTLHVLWEVILLYNIKTNITA